MREVRGRSKCMVALVVIKWANMPLPDTSKRAGNYEVIITTHHPEISMPTSAVATSATAAQPKQESYKQRPSHQPAQSVSQSASSSGWLHGPSPHNKETTHSSLLTRLVTSFRCTGTMNKSLVKWRYNFENVKM